MDLLVTELLFLINVPKRDEQFTPNCIGMIVKRLPQIALGRLPQIALGRLPQIALGRLPQIALGRLP
jgi:hypothetical protein